MAYDYCDSKIIVHILGDWLTNKAGVGWDSFCVAYSCDLGVSVFLVCFRFVVSFESRGQHDYRFVRVRVGVGLVASCRKVWCASCIRIGLL